MSQKRIESTITFSKPTLLKELQSFMWGFNCFKDHLRDHSAVAKPLYEMVALATKQKNTLLDHRRGRRIRKLKALVNSCLKLYVIDYQLTITKYYSTIASGCMASSKKKSREISTFMTHLLRSFGVRWLFDHHDPNYLQSLQRPGQVSVVSLW